MSAAAKEDRHGGEALQAAGHARRGRPGPERRTRSGSVRIASVVLPFLEQAKGRLPDPNLRLDSGVRKFDVVTGETWSLYFRVANTKSHKASHYYIIDLSARSPLILMADSLDVGSGVRRREVWEEALQSHDDVTEQVLAKLLDRAVLEAGGR